MSSTLSDLVKEIQFKTKWTLDDVAMAIGTTRYFLRRAIKENDLEGELYTQLVALKDAKPGATIEKPQASTSIPKSGEASELKDEVIQQLREKNLLCNEEKAFLRQVVVSNQEDIKARLEEIENAQQKLFDILERNPDEGSDLSPEKNSKE